MELRNSKLGMRMKIYASSRFFQNLMDSVHVPNKQKMKHSSFLRLFLLSQQSIISLFKRNLNLFKECFWAKFEIILPEGYLSGLGDGLILTRLHI